MRPNVFKRLRILRFAKNMGENIGQNMSKNVSVKYSQNLLDLAKKSASEALKNSFERVIQKTAEATGFLIGNEIADKKPRQKIIQKQMKCKYIKKNIYAQNINKKLLMILN